MSVDAYHVKVERQPSGNYIVVLSGGKVGTMPDVHVAETLDAAKEWAREQVAWYRYGQHEALEYDL